jgi:hypothetical protein
MTHAPLEAVRNLLGVTLAPAIAHAQIVTKINLSSQRMEVYRQLPRQQAASQRCWW